MLIFAFNRNKCSMCCLSCFLKYFCNEKDARNSKFGQHLNISKNANYYIGNHPQALSSHSKPIINHKNLINNPTNANLTNEPHNQTTRFRGFFSCTEPLWAFFRPSKIQRFTKCPFHFFCWILIPYHRFSRCYYMDRRDFATPMLKQKRKFGFISFEVRKSIFSLTRDTLGISRGFLFNVSKSWYL